MKTYLKYLTLGLVFMASTALADSAEYMLYASTGTAFKLISTTSIGTSTVSGVVTFTSSSAPATVWRIVCNQDTHGNLTSPGVVTPTATVSNTFLPALTPEYFILGKSQNLALIARTTAGSCWLGRTGR